MKRLLVLLSLSLCIGSAAYAQSSNNIMIGGGLDLFKTDNNGIGEKAQIGLELNYFVVSKMALTGGVDFWNPGPTNLILGMRFYPVKPLFLRFRGLIRDNSDLSLGMGYSHALNKNWRLEGSGDYYFNQREFGLRMGVAYIFR